MDHVNGMRENVNVVVSILRRPLDYYTMELNENAEVLSDL